MKKTVLITGASRGIGRACALLFAQKGYFVIANYQTNHAAAASLIDEIRAMGAQGEIICADVSKKEEVDAIFSSYPKIDILINNAGISYEAPLQDMSENDWDHVMDVCQKSVFLCTKAALPAMISQKEGVIINISSMWGICGASCEVAYSTAKAGVIGFTRALAKEVGPSNIRVNAIAPGVIDTDMNACYTKEDLAILCDATPLGRMGTPMEIAQSALFLAEHPFITGEILNVSGGFLI